MSRFLLAYASNHGHTTRIAERIADVLRADGHSVAVHDDVAATDPTPWDYDAVVAGASIHHGHHQSELVDWARRHGTSLTTVPSAFFSVCLAAVTDSDRSRSAAHDYLDDFEERTGWTPAQRTTFAGALQYREYELPTRLVMRVLMQRGGHPTDTSRDVVYTDWEAVEAFARTCAALPAGAAA